MGIFAILFVATVLGTSALVPPALAVDTKGYPAATCQVDTFAGLPPRVSISDIGIENRGTAPITIICQGVKDANNIQRAEVHVRDLSHTDAVRCTLLTNNQTGTTLSSETQATDVLGADPNDVLLTFSSQVPSAAGYYVLGCHVPANDPDFGDSRVGMYLSVEDGNG